MVHKVFAMAESEDEKILVHLSKHGLCDQKWLTPFRNMKIMDSEYIEGKEEKFAMLCMLASPIEKVALRKALGIVDPLSGLEGVNGILKDAGLNVEYWSKVLAKQVGVITVQGLNNMCGIFYPHLVLFAKSRKEQRVLQKLLKMSDNEMHFCKYHDEYMTGFRDRLSQVSLTQKKLQDFKLQGKKFDDEEVQRLCQGLLEILQVPKEFWFPGNTYETFTESFESLHGFLTAMVENNPDKIEDSFVVETASNGLALKGVFKDGKEEFRTKKIVNVPGDIELQLPFHSQRIKVIHCIGKEEENILKNIGNCIEKGSATDYSSTVKLLVVPVASCFFKPAQLKLSDEAIRCLRDAEKSSKKGKQNKFKHFLKEFGSHICLGPFHFGGTYKWNCYSCSIEPTDVSAAKSLQHELIKIYGCMSNPPKNPEVSEKIILDTQYSKDLYEKTYIDISTNGGPQQPISVALWKNHLMAYKSTWLLLDSGNHSCPVWDIITVSHCEDFTAPSLLVEDLKRAWKDMNACNVEIQVLPLSDTHALELKQIVDTKEIDVSSSIEQLSNILRIRQSVMREKMDIQAWPKSYLSVSQVQRYFELIVDMCKKRNPSECEKIKSLLRQVIPPADLEAVPQFPYRDTFRSWVFETDKPHAIIGLNDINLELELCFKFALETINAHSRSNDAILECLSDPDTNLKVNTVVNNTMCHLNQHFHKTGQMYDRLFLTTLHFPFQYAMQDMIYLRGLCDLHFLNDLFQKHTERYFEVKLQNSALKLQAYLILMVIEISEGIDICASPRMNAHLLMLLEAIRESFHPAIKSILHSLTSDSAEPNLAKMNLKQIMDTPANSDVEQEMTQALVPKKAKNPAKDFDMMLLVFDLQRNYPQKLTLLQALEVRDGFVPEVNKCSSRKLYPFMILQKLLSFDHRCFLRLEESAIQDMDSVSQQLKDTEFVSNEEEKLVVNINPLDGLIAILLCADNFLRQDLMFRLAMCQIAVPFILPDPKRKNLTLTLWAMRTIVKQWGFKSANSNEVHGHEVSIISYPTPVISFLRLGTHNRSKSNLINMIINDPIHNTFFHYDCDGGSAPKLLAEGLVDMAWHLPSANDSFGDAVTFMNLHGDARNLEAQIQFLSETCFMHFVLLNAELLDEHGHKVLQTLSKGPGCIVLLQIGNISDTNKYPKSKGLKIEGIIQLDKKNVADTKADIKDIIKGCIAKQWNSKSVSSSRFVDAARHCDIMVDEDDKECTRGKSFAHDLKFILNQIKKNPKDLLQLQGGMYWHKIAMNEKEVYRQREIMGESVNSYTERLHKEIAMIRRAQHECVKKISENQVMNSFLTILHSLSNQKIARNYFMRWVKIILDELSREKLPPLHREYQSKKKELHKAKGDAIEMCKRDIEQLNMKLINASFGLEHLLREIGQVYEAAKFCGSSKHNDLPQIVAELLIEGYPLELMDGDCAHVPMKWVSAVLKQVKSKLNDPLIFVLSILGIQSSGKSTLLNTLFGVNFSVSAGRCTRGAFMQLLPFHHRKGAYLLLVDTEGLKAPELDATKTHNHDNQLGTFVIGLAHLTVINVFGEVSADMNDILQTAVHAFLRMKAVTNSPACHFVYQNVSGVMAGEKAMMGRSKIKENLDKMTKVAAKEEGLGRKYSGFNDVICFDDEKDVTYFPTLWHGNPPMAPVNTKYSMEARKLKESLIACTRHTQVVKFSKFREHLKSFWKAILHENFIFSFRNTLEMSVFSDLDSQRSKWFWNFRKEMISCEENFEIEIHGFTEINKVAEEVYTFAKSRVVKNVSLIYSKIKDEMKTFFEEHQQREILINWESETERLLTTLHDKLKDHAEQHCKQVWHGKKAKMKVNEIKSRHQAVISEKVKVLVSDLDSNNDPLSEKQQRKVFEEQWSEWIKELKAQLPDESWEEHDIELEVEVALKDHFKKQLHEVIKKMTPREGGKLLKHWGEKLALKLEEQHVRVFFPPGWSERFKRWFKMEQWRGLAEEETHNYLQEVQKYLVSKHKKDYNPSFVNEILTLIQGKVEAFRSDVFEFTPKYTMDLALTACGYALKKFHEMAVRYREEHDPVKCLEREKSKYFQDFTDEYKKTAQEIIAARQCCELLEIAIENKVTKNLCLKVVEEMEDDEVNSFLFTKRTLIKKLLAHIGSQLRKCDFDRCSKYLRHPTETIEDYVKFVTEEYCNVGHPYSNLTRYARELIDDNIKYVMKVINDVNKSKTALALSIWIGKFQTKLSERLIIDGTIRCELDAGAQIKLFNAELKRRIELMEGTLKEKIPLQVKDMETWEQRPYDVIFERVCGCTEACPFCKEPCNSMFRDHDGDHTVDLHRPICLGGWRDRDTGKMTLETCTEEVANDISFYVNPQSDVTHPFRRCEDIYPQWHIQEDLPGETSLYWKYVVAHFKSELARLYDMEEKSVPDHWTGFELSQAIDAL